MNVYRKLEHFLENLIKFFWHAFIYIHELKNIYLKRNLVKKYIPTAEEKVIATEYWHGLTGKKIPLWWHRLYASYTGVFDPKYIPEILFSARLELNASNRVDRLSLGDKNNLLLFAQGGGFRLPVEYCRSKSGHISKNGISFDDQGVKDLLWNIGPCVIKKTRDTSSGRDVAIANIINGVDTESNLAVIDIIKKMGHDWVCQERICQHESISDLYHGSVNTLRIVTYLIPSGVGVSPVALRLGRSGSLVDNAHAGGIFISVDNDGYLGDEGFTEYQDRFNIHPDSRIKFADYRIEGVKSAINAAKRSHLVVGGFGFISWDVAIDSDGNPVLIEVNLTSQTVWFPQMASGKAMFGSDTEEVVRFFWKTNEEMLA